MGIFQLWGARESNNEMARKQQKQPDAVRIEAWARQLKASIKDAEAFKIVHRSMASDETLSAIEVIEVAHEVTGIRAKTKKKALALIGQERLRASHAKAKGESAAKTRTW